MTKPYTSVLDDASRAIGALLWQLYQHQNPADSIGQLVRQALNIAPGATMTEAQIAAARRYGESIARRIAAHAKPESRNAEAARRFGLAAAPTPPAEASGPRAGSLWAMITGPLQNHIHRTTDEPNTAADWRGAGHNVVEYVPRASVAPVGTIQATPIYQVRNDGNLWLDCTLRMYKSYEERESDRRIVYLAPANPDDAAAPQPAAQQSADGQDAARWREVLMHVGANYFGSNQGFTFHVLSRLSGANIMRGSVAEHFTNAIDGSIAARADGAKPEGGA